MPFPQEAAFNPKVSKVPVLGASSGNPQSFQDPNNVASIGAKIQAMADQAQADTLYDIKRPEGFRDVRGEGLERLGFSGGLNDPIIAALYLLGFALIIGSYLK